MKLTRLCFAAVLCAAFVSFVASSAPSVRAADLFDWNLGEARLVLTDVATARLVRTDAKKSDAGAVRAFALYDADGVPLYAEKLEKTGDATFRVQFPDGSTADFKTRPGKGYVLVDLIKLDAKKPFERFDIFRVAAPNETRRADSINTAIFDDGFRISLMSTAINANQKRSSNGGSKHDNAGCSHTFRQKVIGSKTYAEFRATSKRDDGGGWSVRGKTFDKPLDLTGCRAIRARVYGDGKGQALKIQLAGKTGHRDDYITIDFKGWKTLDLTKPPLNDLSYDEVRRIAFYYNGLPAKKTVRTLIGRVEAVFGEGESERVVLLEDFKSPTLAYWDAVSQVLTASTVARHGLAPSGCAVVAASGKNWPKAVQEMELAAGLPSPKPGGAWRDESQRIRESYFFLTSFSAKDYEKALAFAKRGGFKQILVEQHSWARSAGTYEINKGAFPGGLSELRETFDKFRAEGIRVGLHFLAASIDWNDPYLTPVPDKRFVLGVSTKLAADLPADATEIPTTTDASVFPTGENAYMGSGQFVRIDDEIIEYGACGKDGLTSCKRGAYKTVVSEHRKGATVSHFVRCYGYHPYDLDTDLAEEIAGNFAKVANALPLDMIYFDGSELLQRPGDGGEHWYYNARLHRVFYDAIDDKNILFQASSWSPYSWHMLSRSASADGHDDLKAYLEERSGGFGGREKTYMPLDIGWYYGYDRRATPDMYEYVLGATIGYDSSMSFQASVDAASKHPFIGEILDMIRIYEEVRLSEKVPQELREQMKIDPILAGKKTEEERNALLDKRNDFHLEISADGSKSFRRVVYPLWQDLSNGDASARTWELKVDRPCRVGLQVHYQEKELPNGVDASAKVVNPKIAISGKPNDGKELNATLSAPSELARGQYVFALPGKKRTKYGQPLAEPEIATGPDAATPDVRLEPGVYRITFSVDSGSELPIRVRTPLYTDEVYSIPKD